MKRKFSLGPILIIPLAIAVVLMFTTAIANLQEGQQSEGKQQLEDAVRRVGAERILYGSDYPGYSPRPFIDCVMRAKLTDAQREAILYKNAERLLGVFS